MKTKYYGDVKVTFTDAEYDRLQHIKRQHYNDPLWTPLARTAKGKDIEHRVSGYVSQAVKQRTERFAQERGISVSTVIRHVLEVLTA